MSILMIRVLVVLFCSFPLSLWAQPYVFHQKVVNADRDIADGFGESSHLSGDFLIVGAPNEDLDASGNNFILQSGAAYIFQRDNLGNWNQIQKLVPSQRAIAQRFGHRVAISGDYAVVGAYNDRLDVNGLTPLNNAGAAYVFERNAAGVWVETQKLVASDRSGGELFGGSVDIDGDRLIVGAYQDGEDANGLNTLTFAGSAYIYERNAAGVWVEVVKLTPPVRGLIDSFGDEVSIDGDYAAVSCGGDDEDENELNFLTNAGAAYVFFRSAGGNWSFYQKVCPAVRTTGDGFGDGIELSNRWLAVGSAYNMTDDTSGGASISSAGSVHLFRRNNAGVFVERQKVVASDREVDALFGWPLSLDGNTLVVGARRETEDVAGANPLFRAGAAYIYERNSGTWNEIQKIVSPDRDPEDFFGFRVDIDQNYIVVSTTGEDYDVNGNNFMDNAGAAYIFEPPVLLNQESVWLEAEPVEGEVRLMWEGLEDRECEVWRGTVPGDLQPWQEGIPAEGEMELQDRAPLLGTSYYQLRWWGADGSRLGSNLTRVFWSEGRDEPRLEYGPQPVDDELWVDLTTLEGAVSLDLRDLSGKVVHTWEKTGGKLAHCSLGSLPSGVYLLQVRWIADAAPHQFFARLVRQ